MRFPLFLAALQAAAVGWSAERSTQDQSREWSRLERYVQAYLSAKSKASRTKAYSRISRHPLGTIENVSKAIRSRRDFADAEPGMVEHELKGKSKKRVSTYSVVVPQGYDPSRQWPLILALAGGRGDGAKYAPFWSRTLKGKDYIVVCPVGRDPWWHTSYLIALAALKDACERYHVDRNRVYLTGMSNGGNGTWFMAIRYPDLFAAAAPMAGCPQTAKGRVDYPYLLNLLNVPVYACHGAADETISIRFDRKAAELLKAQGYDCHLEEIPDGGHGSPQQRVPQIVEWFASKQRDPNPSCIRYLKQTAGLKRCYWLLIGKTRQAAVVEAKIVGRSSIELKTSHVRKLILFLNDQLVDVQRPVMVFHNGQLLKTVEIKPSLRTLLVSAQFFDDPERLYPFEISLTLPK